MRDEEEKRKIQTTEGPSRGGRKREREIFPAASFHRKSLADRAPAHRAKKQIKNQHIQ